MEENMELWDKLKTPPNDALKPITGGRLRGKTDINPQWRYQVITEAFGPIGFGWNYELVREWIVDGGQGEKVHFAQINFKYKYGEDWSEWIPGTGGSMVIEKESGGLHTNDESLKMAITDALSCALKMIGVASDIYRGVQDGSKYGNRNNGNQQPRGNGNRQQDNNRKSGGTSQQQTGKPSAGQIKYLHQELKKAGISSEMWGAFRRGYWKANSDSDITIDMHTAAITIAKNTPNKIKNYGGSK